MNKISYLCEACHWSVTHDAPAAWICAKCDCGDNYDPKTEADKQREFSRAVMAATRRVQYAAADVAVTGQICAMTLAMREPIHKVVFNAPATIVFWTNGEKTVVKCKKGEVYDPEKGLAMAIAKHALGNQGNYYDVFKKWVPKKEERPEHKWVRIPVQPAWMPNSPLDDDFDTYHQCSECYYDVTTPTPYCPECGAKMSVEES